MMRCLLLAFAMSVCMSVAVYASVAKPVGIADPCYSCHTDTTPGIVKLYEASAHAAAGIKCSECHGDDVTANHDRTVKVSVRKCGACHADAMKGHTESKHSQGLKSGRGCTRNMPATPGRDATCSLCHEPGSTKPITQTECAMFLAQSPEMQRQGCGSCHRVEESCDTCHTKHGTSLDAARDAGTCGTCHMGPDHAQLEMWRTSQHGVLYGMNPAGAPTCVTCHMTGSKNERHNVSRGIALGLPEPLHSRERGLMVDVCSACHTKAMATRNLEDAETIYSQSLAQLAEAQEIVEALENEGLLKPAEGERPLHPLFGHKFVLGPLMLYEDISGPEARYFRMMMFYFMSAFKGAFHQNPDYAHWFGNAPLKLTLSELKQEAEMLRKLGNLEKRLDNLSQGGSWEGNTPGGKQGSARELKNSLRALRDSLLRGEIGEEEHQREKEKLLEHYGL